MLWYVGNGEDDLASKKEADAYDKLLDTADELMHLLAGAPVRLEPEQQESLAFYLAQQRDLLQNVLRGAKGRGAASQIRRKSKVTRTSKRQIPQARSVRTIWGGCPSQDENSLKLCIDENFKAFMDIYPENFPTNVHIH